MLSVDCRSECRIHPAPKDAGILLALYNGKTGTTGTVIVEESSPINANIVIVGAEKPDVEVVDGKPATDTTGNGKLNDINGDGEFDIFDVQALYIDILLRVNAEESRAVGVSGL